jgi:hypothetical protein
MLVNHRYNLGLVIALRLEDKRLNNSLKIRDPQLKVIENMQNKGVESLCAKGQQPDEFSALHLSLL